MNFNTLTVENIRKAIMDLYRSGAGEDLDADEMVELLDDIDFFALAQVLHHSATAVYEFRTEDDEDFGFGYYGAELFPYGMLLAQQDEIDLCGVEGLVDVSRSLELWLLEDMSLAVVVCYQTTMLDGRYVSEYRTRKPGDWKNNGMNIDFLELTNNLEERSEAFTQREIPMYEL